jgi:lipopolysaccharide transport system ATP-binding protein
LGSGINPILTGRENIYINGAVLGLGKKEVDEKLDSIIEFAELKDSIDAPVKNYSTGMKVRLGFAIAAQIKPDILIIDEVLSVGDVGFQAKCFNHICDLLDSTAIILVSHSMQQISRLCTHSLHLHSGKIKYLGDDVGASVASYYKHSHLNQSIFEFGEGQAEIHRVDIESDQTLNPSVINSGESLKIHVTFSADSDIKNLSIGFVFSSEGLVGVLSCLSNLDGFQIQNNGKQMTITANLGAIRLNPGTYWLRVGILADNFGKILVRKDNIKSFIVKGPIVQWAPVQWRADWKINPT